MPRPHVSYTELTNFANGCQWRWKLDYLEGKYTEKFSIHFDFGHAVHSALEKYVSRKNSVELEVAQKLFFDEFEKLTKEHEGKYPLKPQDFAGLVKSGYDILASVKDLQELKDCEIVHNEYPVWGQIDRTDGVEIKFKGFIDLVVKSKDKRGNVVLYIIDFKTCSWGWGRDERDDRWKHFQVFLYKYFFCKKYNIDPKQVRTAFILLKKRPPKGSTPVEFFAVSAGPVSVQRALDMLNNTISEMVEREKDGSFSKNRSLCKDRYGNSCPFLGTPLCPE